MSGECGDMRNADKEVAPYGSDYLSWKNWGNDNFGKLTKTDIAYYNAEIKRTDADVRGDCRILEIGFGNGGFLRFARGKGWKISGTEVNEELVKSAKEQGFNAIHCQDVAGFEDDAFDLVVAFDVIEHVAQDQMYKFLLGIKRIVCDGGHVILRFPNGDSPFGLPYQNGDITHVTVIGSGKAVFFAEKLNFELVFLGGEAQPIVGTRPIHFCHRIVAVPVKRLINFFVRNIFFPRSYVDFCASNLTVIYKIRKERSSMTTR